MRQNSMRKTQMNLSNNIGQYDFEKFEIIKCPKRMLEIHRNDVRERGLCVDETSEAWMQKCIASLLSGLPNEDWG